MSERKNIILELARGAYITASRTVPFPHAYALVVPRVSVVVEYHDHRDRFLEIPIDESEAQRLVDLKWIAGRPTDALWDHICFDVSNPLAVMEEALTYHVTGYGDCPTCHETMGLTARGKLARHGHMKLPDGSARPACEGSGKEPLRPVYPLKVNDAAA